MHRFFVPPEQTGGDGIQLSEADAHHAAVVLRLRGGDAVTVLDGAGHQFLGTLAEVSRKRATVAVTQRVNSPESFCRVTLFQAIPKARLIESIIQKATELGVACVVPLLTERVITDLTENDAKRKQEKWQAIAIEALKQSGSAWLPKIETPMGLVAALERPPAGLALIASLHPGATNARRWFDELKHADALPQTISVWIGPEGDFTPEEVAAILAAGAKPITLGPLVLRCETAATYCMAIVNHELQSRRA